MRKFVELRAKMYSYVRIEVRIKQEKSQKKTSF